MEISLVRCYINKKKGDFSADIMRIKSIITAIVFIFICSLLPLHADIPWLHVDGNLIKDPSGKVIVLRGISLIDLGFLEGWQGGAINMIDRLTDGGDTQGSSPGWYPKVIRIPICPSDSVSGWPYRWSPSNDDFYNELLRPVVDYCATKDLYVIIDWHYVSDTWTKANQTCEFWQYMAPRFTDDSHVFFELFNEPINRIGSDTENWLSVRTDMQIWIDIVRAFAPDNLILVGGPSWCQGIGPAADYPLSGDNIVIVSHIYPGHWRSPTWYKNNITTCAAAYPVIMTEWGFSQSYHADSGSLLYGTITDYGQPLMDFIEGLKIGNTAWVASHGWGPPMFWTDWTLRCGEGEMGCFVKDTLYKKTIENQIIISGTVKNDFGEGVDGVTITFSEGEGTATTNTDGNYIFSVNPGWSGTVTPERTYYTFQPSKRTYSNVKSNQFNQDFTCSRIIYAPLNFAGQRVLNRSLSQAEYINVLSWQGHPNNEDIALYRIYLIEGDNRKHLVQLSSDKCEYWHRGVGKYRQYVYSIVAVSHRGREGSPAYTTVH